MSEELSARINHLEFILGVTDRLARNSFILKGWSVTLVAAFFLLTTRGVNPQIAMIAALLPSLTFWGLDAYYLRQEKLYRELYDAVRLEKTDDNLNPFTLDAKPYREKVESWWVVVFSPTVTYFHVVVVAVVAIAFWFFTLTVDPISSRIAECDQPSIEAPPTTD